MGYVTQEIEAVIIVDFRDTGISDETLEKVAEYLADYFVDRRISGARLTDVETDIRTDIPQCVELRICAEARCTYTPGSPAWGLNPPEYATVEDCLNGDDFTYDVDEALKACDRLDILVDGEVLAENHCWEVYIDEDMSSIPGEDELLAFLAE